MTIVDAVIIIAYLVSMMSVGIACRGRQKTASDYFTSHGTFTGMLGTMLIGLSIAASFFSGISLLAYPSIVYQNGITIIFSVILLPLSGWLTAAYFLPRYIRAGTSEPYEIIERRFGYSTRAVAAGMFLLLRTTWMATLIYVPSIAMVNGFGIDAKWLWPLMLAVGLTSTVYTVFGGLRGVIVTDAIQFVIIILGVLWPILAIFMESTVDLSSALTYLDQQGRMKAPSFSFNLTSPFTFWSMLFGFTIGNLGMYLADQMSLQRYLSTPDIRTAQRAFVINIGGAMLVITLLVVLGLALVVWYGQISPTNVPEKADDIFPRFIATQLPVGAPGLIFAAMLAATMSSITSGINSLAATVTLDFVSRIGRLKNDETKLRFSRGCSLVIGLLATAMAGIVGQLGTVFEISQTLIGVFIGPLMTCMLLAVSSWKLSSQSVIAGLFVGTIAGWCVIATPIDRIWVSTAAAAATAVIPLIEIGCRYVSGYQTRQPVRTSETSSIELTNHI